MEVLSKSIKYFLNHGLLRLNRTLLLIRKEKKYADKLGLYRTQEHVLSSNVSLHVANLSSK
jgi:hypothetical protein